MPETTITALTNASALDGTERVPMDQAGVTVDASTLAIAQTLPNATISVAGKQSAADKAKLDGIATGATANSSDATLLARANHTGTQAAGTITGLATVATTGAYADLSGKPTLGTAAATAATDYAPAAQGVTGGDTHNHDGGDGAQIAYSSLSGLPTLPTGTNTGDQTLANTSDATSHTVSLSASGGSVQLVEGSNITLTTSGTSGAGVVTIASTGGGTPGGSTTQVQFNDAGTFGGDVDLTWNKTTNVLTVGGDVNLNDGGTFTTTLQCITPTANRTVSIADGTGTLAFVAGSSGQTLYNLSGALAGTSTTFDATTGTRFVVPFGYGAGAGGTVTQATNKATGATLNTRCGQVTLNGAALAADTTVSFVLTNSQIAAGDVLILNHISGGTAGSYLLNARSAAGSATIDVRNITAGSLSEAVVIAFAVIKATTT